MPGLNERQFPFVRPPMSAAPGLRDGPRRCYIVCSCLARLPPAGSDSTLSASPPDDRPSLSVWDAASLIVGIVIGSSIYKSPPDVFSNVPSPAWGLGLWIAGGLLSLAGALVYAELATTYPRCGGEYNYLSRAFGRGLGFLYAWAQLSVIQTGSIG